MLKRKVEPPIAQIAQIKYRGRDVLM